MATLGAVRWSEPPLLVVEGGREPSSPRAVGAVAAWSKIGVAVVDEAERPLAFLVCADEPAAANGAAAELRARCAARPADQPFGVLASPSRIVIFHGDAPEPVAQLATAEVVAAYHPAFRSWHITPRYLMTLLEAWLSDLTYGWHGALPGRDALEQAGLAASLQGATLHVVPDEQGGLRP